MGVLDIIERTGIVPVVVLEDANWAIPTAEALLKGGINVMEITFRTEAAADCIRAVSRECPDMLVGAGTIVNLEQCRCAVECGARFIVSPGFCADVVDWCLERGVAVVPGCVSPSEIMMALERGLHVLKFFPADVYGGLEAMKSLGGPFGGVKFIPTGGINDQNIGKIIAAPFVHAVGGSWICPKAEIANGNYCRITELCIQARKKMLGYELGHIGINLPDTEACDTVCNDLADAFGFGIHNGETANFLDGQFEVLKHFYRGAHGHIAIRTNSVVCAAADLEKKGYQLDMSTAGYSGGRLRIVYLEKEFGGFALHLLQK